MYCRSVIGQFLHNSLWPTFLRTDSAATFSSTKRVLFMSFFKTFMLVLIAVTAIVTPLGLYEGIVAEQAKDDAVFHYIKDLSPMGYGTPPRTNVSWSRLCGFFGLIPCPNDNNEASVFENRTLLQINFTTDWYDSSIPQKVIDVFQSGASDLGETVSGPFDIQYRSYIKTMIDDMKGKNRGPLVDNGTAMTVGTYQPLSSLVLSDAILPVEGLIVDMKSGGIGFRNHSAPVFRPYGSAWTEDLLFVVPDTVCVNTNITLDFHVARTRTENNLAQSSIFKPELVDAGGYVNLNKTYPLWYPEDPQSNPNLYYRAYRGAWLQNAYSMVLMNVTNLTNETMKVKAFAYRNTTFGKGFPLYFPDGKTAGTYFVKPNSISIAPKWGSYFDGVEGRSNFSKADNRTYNYTSYEPIYSNPFRITNSNWTDIGMFSCFPYYSIHLFSSRYAARAYRPRQTLPSVEPKWTLSLIYVLDLLCRGQGGADLANITNIVAACGLLYGAPRRKDNTTSSLFDPGSAWTLPMYSCLSTAKATIKTVSFRFNGTSDDLSGLEVISVSNKVYANEESKPLWGVENTSMRLKDGGPLWGLISKDKTNILNLTTVRKEALYLPGPESFLGNDNTPAADFASIALKMTYKTGPYDTSPVDYSGKANLAMYKKWQELSQTPESSAKILNLIWTDIAANMVVGTKGLEPHVAPMRKRDDTTTSSESKTPPVINYTRRVRYKYVYGIPAFLTLTLFVASILTTTVLAIVAGAKPSTMKTFLQHLSAGRFLTSQSNATANSRHSSLTGYAGHSPSLHDDEYSNLPTGVWVKGKGKQRFTLGAEGWMKSVKGSGFGSGFETKGGAGVAYARVRGEEDER